MTIMAQVVGTEKTAEVVLLGAKAEERKPTTMNPLGTIIEVSAMPLKDAIAERRKLYFRQGLREVTPFESVDHPEGDKVRLVARQDAEMVVLAIVDPATGDVREERYENGVKAGDEETRWP